MNMDINMNLKKNVNNNRQSDHCKEVNTMTYSKKYLAIALVALTSTAIQARTILDDSKVLDFKVAKTGLTRLSILNDTIEDVYSYPAEEETVRLHKSGHVFITPDDLETPLYVTVITRKGLAQDLRLTPQAKRAEPILLEYRDPEPSVTDLQAAKQEYCANLLTQFIQDKIPPEFLPITVPEVSRGKDPLTANLDKAWGSPQYKVLVFTVHNNGEEKEYLTNNLFWSSIDMASAFSQSTIEPQTTAKLYVIQQR